VIFCNLSLSPSLPLSPSLACMTDGKRAADYSRVENGRNVFNVNAVAVQNLV
jgi:hypothetical protein